MLCVPRATAICARENSGPCPLPHVMSIPLMPLSQGSFFPLLPLRILPSHIREDMTKSNPHDRDLPQTSRTQAGYRRQCGRTATSLRTRLMKGCLLPALHPDGSLAGGHCWEDAWRGRRPRDQGRSVPSHLFCCLQLPKPLTLMAGAHPQTLLVQTSVYK